MNPSWGLCNRAASSVAEAWLSGQPGTRVCASVRVVARGPVLAFAGSRSVVTTAQTAAAGAMAPVALRPRDLIDGGAARDAAMIRAREALARGQDCLVHLTADPAGPVPAAELATRSAGFVADVLAGGAVAALVVAGGDTSSAIVTALAPDWLDHAGEVCAGVPILRARIAGADLPLVLKGGQMGGPDFFAQAVAALKGG